MNKVIAAVGLVLGLGGSGLVLADTIAQAGSSSGAQAGSQSGSESSLTLNSVNVVPRQHYPASQAASLLLQTCQDGASASSVSRGMSFGTDSAQCAAIRQAAVHLELYEKYKAVGMKAEATRQWNLASAYIDKADMSADVGHYPKIIGGTITSLLPVALLFVLF